MEPTLAYQLNPKTSNEGGRCGKHNKLSKDENLRLCPACQRIAVERTIVNHLLDHLEAEGYKYWEAGCHDGTEDMMEVREAIFALDEANVNIYKLEGKAWTPDAKRIGMVFFVFGNDGYDVIADNSTSLNDLLEPTEHFAARYDN